MTKNLLLLFFFTFSLDVVLLTAQEEYLAVNYSKSSSIFLESFENNNNNWITDNNWISGRIANGIYIITCKNWQGQTGLTYKTIQIDQSKNYVLEASFKIIRGTGGLVFGQTEKFDHYRVEFDSKDKILVLKDTPSGKKQIEKIFSGSAKSANKSGSFNKLTIRKTGDVFYFSVNDSLVCRKNNIKPEGDQIGFNVGENSEISIDFLNISYLTSQTAPIMAERNFVKKDSLKSSSEKIADIITTSKDTSITARQNESNIPKIPAGPKIMWVSPSRLTTPLETYTARVRANIKSGSELKSVLFYVNGASKGEGETKSIPGESGSYLTEKTITLNPGENTIYLVATNFEGANKSELRYFNNPPANPPVISWGNPSIENVIVNTDRITIEACIESPTELKSAMVLVNGNAQGENSVFQVSGISNCNYKWQRPIVLKEGDNSIYIVATNIAGSTTSEKRTIRFLTTLAEKRIALVFGNSQYGDKEALKNPVNDANLMEATLKELGFEVMKRINAGKKEMEQALMEFSQKLPTYNVALFYFAGHGLQVDGINYLIPTDAKLQEKVACKWETVSVSDVVSEFEKYPNNINIVILDACRNNPYRNWVRGNEAGFRFITDVSGTIIAYATVEGATAADGSGANGLYTEELVRQMTIPQSVESVFKRTRVQVEMRSNGTQSPRESSGLRGEFYFKK